MASAALLGAVFASPAIAQEETDYALDTITITGSGLPTEVMNSPASVTVLDEEQIKKIPPSSVANLLRDVPGVRVTQSGIERIQIRGESSQRVAIMIDGQKITDHSNYGTPILIAPTEIERIEVVKGPSSVTSGNAAIGGVVNIITKRGAAKPIEATVSAGYLSASQGYRANTSLAGTVGDFDYRLGWSQSDLKNRETPDGELVPSGSNDRDINAFLGYRMGKHYIGARAQDYDLSADVYVGVPGFEINLPKRDLRKYSAFYEGEDLTPWMSLLKIDAYTQTVDREFESNMAFGPGMFSNSTSNDDQKTSGFKATANMEFAAGHRTVVGFEYEDDSLISDKIATRVVGGPPSVTTRYSDASIETASIFAQHEMEMGQATTATFGMRYYNVESELSRYIVNGVAQPTQKNSDDKLLGSVGLVHQLTETSVLRANISQGYNYPSLSQLFLTSVGAGGTVIGNPDLKPEDAINYEVGARIDNGRLVLDAALFYTDSKNYIASLATGVPRESRYENVNSAETWGFEVAAELDPGWRGGMRPYFNISNVNRTFTYADGTSSNNTGTPKWSGDIGVRGDWALQSTSGTWDMFVRGESGHNDAADTRYGGYGTLNLRGTVDLTESVDVSFELGNIFDRSYDSANQLPGAGRNVSLFLTATF
jgi:hemoglobin/transferrin/lactoferrin receptor protein